MSAMLRVWDAMWSRIVMLMRSVFTMQPARATDVNVARSLLKKKKVKSNFVLLCSIKIVLPAKTSIILGR